MKLFILFLLFLNSATGFSCIPAFDSLDKQKENATSIFIAEILSSELNTTELKAPCNSRFIKSSIKPLKIIKGIPPVGYILWPEYSSELRKGSALVVVIPRNGIDFAEVRFEKDWEDILEQDFSELIKLFSMPTKK